MQITSVKDLNLYTNKRITSYEFDRMDSVFLAYKVVCSVFFGLIFICIIWLIALSLNQPIKSSPVFKNIKTKTVPTSQTISEESWPVQCQSIKQVIMNSKPGIDYENVLECK